MSIGNDASGFSNQSCATTWTAVPIADFTASPTSGYSPLTVQFTDTSTGTVTGWLWDLGDNVLNTAQNPSYTYNTPGNYDITLTAAGPNGSDDETKQGLITVLEPEPYQGRLTTPFIEIPDINGNGYNELAVSMIDKETGAPIIVIKDASTGEYLGEISF